MDVVIDKEHCIACGACIDDCLARNLYCEDGVVRARSACILCGHCVAICPTNAVCIPAYDMAEVEPCIPADKTIAPKVLLDAVKSRRSIRNFRACALEAKKVHLLLQAGRYTATAKNAQACRFILVQKNLMRLKALVWDGLAEELKNPETKAAVQEYAPFLEEVRESSARDYLFRNAPAVVYVAAQRADDACLAAQNMELMAASLGWGVLYNGYLCRASNRLVSVRNFLEAGKRPLQIAMLLGYPAVSYRRTAPRLPGDFVLK